MTQGESPERLLLATLREARQLLRGVADDRSEAVATAAEPTLLQQCLAMCQAPPLSAEPIRTVHHFACSGGTVISKCLAAMPNVHLLSEVDPLSPFVSAGSAPKFTPSDMSALLRWGTRAAGQDLQLSLFQAELRTIHEFAVQRGRYLTVRDHSHGHFCFGSGVPDRPSMRTIVSDVAAVLSILTVRNPFDSFASLSQMKWLHFKPSTFDEYVNRYMRFLDHYAGVPLFRYEDLIEDPNAQMTQMCQALSLPFSTSFVDTFPAFRMSGDSGRKADVLTRHPRRESSVNLQEKHGSDPLVRELLERLGYSIAD